jgi:DNA-binding MarR family transcriptional regulator
MGEQCFCTTLRNATRRVTAMYDEALRPLGVGIAQFGLLRKVGRSEPVTLSDLGDLAELDRSTVGRNVRVLERMKLVVLRPGEQDQRETVVLLSAQGRKLLQEGDRLWRSAQRGMKARLGTAAAAALLETLGEL